MNANRRKETWITLTDPGFIEGLGLPKVSLEV